MRSFVYFVLVRLIGAITGRGRVSQLQLENAVLRHQVSILRRTVRRPDLKDRDRTLLAAASRALCQERWTSFMVTAQTLHRWHRELVRRKWTYRPRGPGRPPLDPRTVSSSRDSPGRTRGGDAFGFGESSASSGSGSVRPRSGASCAGQASGPLLDGSVRHERVPPGAGEGSAGVRLLHRGDSLSEDALCPVLHRARPFDLAHRGTVLVDDGDVDQQRRSSGRPDLLQRMRRIEQQGKPARFR